jgi:hypothetical protein
MEPLSPSLLLTVWERGIGQAPAQQALLLLGTLLPEADPDALAARSIGRRNALLLTLRRRLFGERFVSTAACPACGERIELTFLTDDIGLPPVIDAPDPATVAAHGYSATFRLPNSGDLLALMHEPDAAAAQERLLARCVMAAAHDGQSVSVSELPPALVAAIAQEMEARDPLATIQLALTCPACGHGWAALLDLGAYLWREVDAWAKRTLREVHVLASAYGWSEEAILAMGPGRRQRYLELIGR